MNQDVRYGEGQSRDKLHTRPGFRPRHDKPKFTPKAKGHDALLKDLQEAGVLVAFRLMGVEEKYIGKIVARDKFTVSVLTERTDGTFDEFPTVIYKHALESFKQVSKIQSVVGGTQ